MGLFGKKKAETKSCCGGSCNGAARKEGEVTSGIKVLGAGCAKCNALEEATQSALTELGMDPTVDHVTDYVQIASYGVMSTPALVVDGKVLSCGKVLTKDEVKALLQRAKG